MLYLFTTFPVSKASEETKRSNKQKFMQNRSIRKLEDINFQKDASQASGKLINDKNKLTFKLNICS